MTQEKEIYLLKRDKDESARYVLYVFKYSMNNLRSLTTDKEYVHIYRCRLDEQHTFFVDVIGGSPIHASISKDRLFAVADIATGTG